MSRVEGDVLVPAPLHEVFEFASDWQKWPEWWVGVSAFRPTTEIVRGNGARYAYKARLMGIWANVETEIREFREDAGWTGVATKGMPHHTYWLFESQGEQTRFTYALEYRLPVPVFGPLLDSLVVGPQWRRIIDCALNNLKSHFADRTGSSDGA